MTSSLRLWLVVAALLAGALLAACGGDENGDADGAADQPTTAAAVEDGDADGAADEDGDDGVDEGDDAFDDISVPAGADQTGSGSWSGTLPFGVPGGDIDPEAYTTLEFREYEVDASPEDVIDFYRDEMGDWDEAFVFSGGEDGDEGGIGVWTRDDGRMAVFISADRSDGVTTLVVIRGSAE